MFQTSKYKSLFGIVFIFGLLAFSCKKKPVDNAPDFQKGPLLENVSGNLIVPEYQSLLNDITVLEASFNQFSADKSQNNFDALRVNWKTAYISWHNVIVYEIGPAMTYALRSSLGSMNYLFPFA